MAFVDVGLEVLAPAGADGGDEVAVVIAAAGEAAQLRPLRSKATAVE